MRSVGCFQDVRILARILLLPAALFLVATGSYGVLASYGSGTEFADQARRQLQALNRWLIDEGFAVPRDLAVTSEEWVAETFLRFVLLPTGLVLLAFCIGLLGRSGDAISEVPDDEPGDSDASADKRTVKRILKQANALKKQGEMIEAAELLWNHELLDTAADFFVAAGEFIRAAEIRHDQNRFVESAELHLRGENYEAAGSIFGQQEEWAQAANCYLKGDLKSVAAEMFEKAENYREAADCYRETDLMRHAAAMYVKCRKWRFAADCLEIVFVDEGGKSMMDPKKSAEMSKLVRQAGRLFLKAEDPEKAFEIFDRGGCSVEAGEVASNLGNHEVAALHFRQAGDVERAADSLRRAGQPDDAARLLGQHLRDAGENERAAMLLQEAGDHLEAGDLYRNLEQYSKAAECYAEQHGFAQAAEMFQLAGDREQAGEAFEKAGRFTEAAECFALVGKPAREAELLEKAGDFLRSGETFHHEGLDDEAISALQKVPQEDEEFARAAAILGGIFAARGQLAIAVTKLQQAIGDTELTRESVDGYYKLATIYQEDGKTREAVEIFEKIMAFDYHHADVEERLAETRAVLAEEEPLARATQNGAGAAAGSPGAEGAAEEGRYQIIGELGRGGMGIVYKVRIRPWIASLRSRSFRRPWSRIPRASTTSCARRRLPRN